MRTAARALKWGAGIAAAATAASSAGLAYEYGPDILPRLLTLYSVAVPATIDYKSLQYAKRYAPWAVGVLTSARDYEELHAKWAPRMLEATFKLRGFFLKGGQLVASNYGNAFPALWQRTFEPALDKQPHLEWPQVRALIESELGRPLEAVFSSVDPEPLAAASIGQVHRGKLRDSGRTVVLKVMYPAVERQFRGDVALTKAYYRAVLPEQAGALDEVEAQFVNEFDYRREAAQMELVRANLAAVAASFPHVWVPVPVLPLCSKGLLVMEEVVGGVKLTQALRDDFSAYAAETGRSLEALIAQEQAANAAVAALGGLRSGPSSDTMQRSIKLLRARNWFAPLVRAAPRHVPLNHAALIDDLLAIQGHQVLVDGAFSSDPHPGNILVQRAPDGAFQALALIDFGQVKLLTAEQRLQMARLIVALSRAQLDVPAHAEVVARFARDMGLVTARSDPSVQHRLAALSFDRDDDLFTQGLNAQELMEQLHEQDPTITLPQQFVLVSRASLLLRGLGHMLNQHRSVAAAWAPIAEGVLRAAGEDPDAILLPRPAAAKAAAVLGTPSPALPL